MYVIFVPSLQTNRCRDRKRTPSMCIRLKAFHLLEVGPPGVSGAQLSGQAGHGAAAAGEALRGAGLPAEELLLADDQGLQGLGALPGVARAAAADCHGVPAGEAV